MSRSKWNWLLWIAIVLPLIVPVYNRTEPTLLGFPFYYWCQLGYVALAMFVVTMVRLLTARRR